MSKTEKWTKKDDKYVTDTFQSPLQSLQGQNQTRSLNILCIFRKMRETAVACILGHANKL